MAMADNEIDVVALALAVENYLVRDVLSYRPGSSGARLVLRCLDERSGEEVAIKVFLRGAGISQRHLEREVVHHRGLVHKHVVSFKRVFLTRYYLCIVMMYAPHGNVHQWVRRVGCFPEALARALFQQVVCAVEFCHRRKVFNRDIKLDNLLTTLKGAHGERHFVVQLCDFGFAKGRNDSAPKTLAGTLGYIAPEVVKAWVEHKSYSGRAADIWSLGICLYYMLYGSLPMVSTPSRPKTRHWWLGAELGRLMQLNVEIPEVHEVVLDDGLTGVNRVTDPCRLLLSRLLCADPAQRITLDELTRNPWFLTDYPADLVGYNDRLVGDYEHDISARLGEALQSEEELKALVALAVEKVAPRYSGVGSPWGGSASNVTTFTTS